MDVTNKRIMIEFHILCQYSDYITTSEIAKAINVTDRTIKNDMSELKQLVKDNGGKLITKQGYGLKIEVVDEKLFNLAKTRSNVKFYYVDGRNNTLNNRSDQIAKMIIMEKGYVKIEDVADRLYLSKSTIKQEIKTVRDYLAKFDLSIRSTPGKGIKIDGEELRKRLCMVELIKVHFPYTPYEEDDNQKFWHLFENNENKLKIREKVLKILRETRTTIVDEYINKFVSYLSLTQYRIKDGYHAKIGDMYKHDLKNFKEYQIANELAKELEKIDFFLDENEVYCIELLILIWRDLRSDVDIVNDYPLLSDEAKIIAEDVLWIIKDRSGIDFVSDDNIMRLARNLIPILAKVYFNIYKTITSQISVSRGTIKRSSLSMLFASICVKYINHKYDVELSNFDISRIAIVFVHLIDLIEFDYIPRNVILYINTGFEGAEIVRDKIIRHFHEKCFNKIDIYGYYEGRIAEKNGYDYAIMNFKEFSYRYDTPYVHVSQILSADEIEEIRQKIVFSGYQLDDLIIDLNLRKEHFHKDYKFTDKNEFASSLAFELAGTIKDYRLIYDHINSVDKNFITNEVLSIIIERSWTSKNYFGLYQLNKPIIWNDRTVKYILVSAIDYRDNLAMVKLFDMLNMEFTYDHSKMDELIDAFDYFEAIKDIVRKNITM